MKKRPDILKLTSLLLFVILFPLVSCQRNKLNSEDLTTINVKRDLPTAPTGSDVTPDTTKSKESIEPKMPPVISLKGETISQLEPKKEVASKPNTTKTYHIIVASHPNESLAEQTLAKLEAKGYDDVQIIVKDNRYRVSIGNYTNKKEAFEQRDKLAEQLGQDDLWVTLY